MAKRETFYFYNNLVCLVKSIENQFTTIDLHNEECVTGKIVSVDGYMNMELENAVFYNARGEEIPFKTFFVRGRCVRYVHIPTNVSLSDAIKKYVAGPPKREKAPRKPTFKQKRAERKQRETLQHLQNTTSSQ